MTECALEIDSAYGNAPFLGMYNNLVCTNLLMGLEFKWFKCVKVKCWTATAEETQRESGARVPQTSRRQYRGVVCVSPSTHQTTDRDRGLARIKKKREIGEVRSSDDKPPIWGTFRRTQVRPRCSGQRARPALSLSATKRLRKSRSAFTQGPQLASAANLRSSTHAVTAACIAGEKTSRVYINDIICEDSCAVRGFVRTHFLPFTRSDRESRTTLHLLNLWNKNVEDSILTFCHFDIHFSFLVLAIKPQSRRRVIFAGQDERDIMLFGNAVGRRVPCVFLLTSLAEPLSCIKRELIMKSQAVDI